MQTAFVGRADELRVLEAEYARRQGSLVVVFGRRRIGKTELIRQFTKDKPTICFTGKEAPRQVLINDFIEQANLHYGRELARPGEVSSWKAAIRLAVQAHRDARPLVLVFDELQWAASDKAAPELLGTLQELWDHEWKACAELRVILCSSFMGYLERLLASKSPLFGRTTRQIHLRALSPSEARLFQPNWSVTHQAQAYFIAGGVPLYHQAFEARKPIARNLVDSFLTPTAPLFREGDLLLREEFRELPSYFALLLMLAEQRQRHKDLKQGTGLSDLQYYLHRLGELRYVRKVLPLAARAARTDVYYELEDPFLRFWFRFVFKHISAVEQYGPERAFRLLVEPRLNNYFAECFEEFCRQQLRGVYVKVDRLACGFEVGQYWKAKTVQIDVVGRRADGWVDFGECKWGPVESLPAVVAELDRKIAKYPLPEDASIGRRLFLHHPLKSIPTLPVTVHTLDQLYHL